MQVVVVEVVDPLDELSDGGEGAAPDRLLGDPTKPTPHLIEPQGGGRGEVHVATGPFGQPGANLRVLVGRVVVDDQMQLERRRHTVVQVRKTRGTLDDAGAVCTA